MNVIGAVVEAFPCVTGVKVAIEAVVVGLEKVATNVDVAARGVVKNVSFWVVAPSVSVLNEMLMMVVLKIC